MADNSEYLHYLYRLQDLLEQEITDIKGGFEGEMLDKYRDIIKTEEGLLEKELTVVKQRF